MAKRKQEPNYQMILNSAICGLQQAYKDYKKAIIKNLDFTWINNDGDFSTLAGIEERNKEIAELNKEVIRLQAQVYKMQKKIGEVEQDV